VRAPSGVAKWVKGGGIGQSGPAGTVLLSTAFGKGDDAPGLGGDAGWRGGENRSRPGMESGPGGRPEPAGGNRSRGRGRSAVIWAAGRRPDGRRMGTRLRGRRQKAPFAAAWRKGPSGGGRSGGPTRGWGSPATASTRNGWARCRRCSRRTANRWCRRPPPPCPRRPCSNR